jgi:hypothetical protein
VQIPYTKTAWPETSLALPEYTPNNLKHGFEQAIYNANAHRHTAPNNHILLLPNGEHSPYRNLHSVYVQKVISIPYYPTHTPTPATRNLKLNIYLVSNEKALVLLHRTHILTTLHTTITKLT